MIIGFLNSIAQPISMRQKLRCEEQARGGESNGTVRKADNNYALSASFPDIQATLIKTKLTALTACCS